MPDEGTGTTEAAPQAADASAAVDQRIREGRNGPDAQTQDGAGGSGDSGAAPVPGLDDRSPEEMLAEAIEAGDDGGAFDVAAQLKRLEKQHADLKRHSRTWETRAKENAAAAAKLRELEDAGKTEIQRATDRAVQAEKRAAEAESLYHRTLAAAMHDIPPGLIDQIHGSTEDEINASAEALAAAINERAAVLAAAQAQANGGQQPYRSPPGFRGPVESLRPGALPASDNKPRDPNTWFREVLASRKQ